MGHTGEGEIYEYKYDERYVVKATKTTKGTAICRMKLRFINLSNQSLDLSRLGGADYIVIEKYTTSLDQERNCGSVLKSLEYIHSSGYIHGDVIAENVLVSGNKVVLGDFGWVKNGTEWFNRIDHDLLAYERIMIRLITGQWYNYDVWFTLRDGPNVKKIPMDDVIERYLKNLWNGDLYQLD
jgi:serine/threonine protein kinase